VQRDKMKICLVAVYTVSVLVLQLCLANTYRESTLF
jgi:hypothetical protein